MHGASCQSLIRSMKCMEFVDRRHQAPEKHLCEKRKCEICGKYVQSKWRTIKIAKSADFNNSAQYVNFNVANLDRDAFIFQKYNLNLSYDGIRLKWNNTLKELQEFFQNTVGLNGKWISPGGSSKSYIDADFDLIANWYPGKQNSLLFQGKDGSLLPEFLINLFTQVAVLNYPDKNQSQSDNIDIEGRSLSTSFVESICDYTNDVDTPKAKKDAISVVDASSIEELEHFIDNSYQNMSVLNTDHYVLESTPLRLSTCLP